MENHNYVSDQYLKVWRHLFTLVSDKQMYFQDFHNHKS